MANRGLTAAFGRSGSEVFTLYFALGHLISRYVDHEPVKDLAVDGIFAAWRVRIDEYQRVEHVRRLGTVAYGRIVFDLENDERC